MYEKFQLTHKNSTSNIINFLIIFSCGIFIFNTIITHKHKLQQQQEIAHRTAENRIFDFSNLNHVQYFHKLLLIWDNVVTIADGTVNSNMQGPLSDLKRIRRLALVLPTPNDCISKIKNQLIQSMNMTIDQFTEIMDNRIVHRSEMNKAFDMRKQAADGYEKCLLHP